MRKQHLISPQEMLPQTLLGAPLSSSWETSLKIYWNYRTTCTTNDSARLLKSFDAYGRNLTCFMASIVSDAGGEAILFISDAEFPLPFDFHAIACISKNFNPIASIAPVLHLKESKIYANASRCWISRHCSSDFHLAIRGINSESHRKALAQWLSEISQIKA